MKLLNVWGLVLGSLLLAGCGDHAHRHTHDHGGHGGHGHHHEAPHGGTLVVLGNEEFHIAFLRQAEAGAMLAYILDGHAHQFIRIAAPSFEVAARPGGEEALLVFRAVGQAETGETVGNTAMFRAEADWLREVDRFEAVLQQITIRGREYSQVPFGFPEGNE
jgi:hypothetical protein